MWYRPLSMLRITLALAALAGVSCWTAEAAAFERQWHLGAGLGSGIFPGIGGSGAPFGEELQLPVLGAHAGYGISDMFDARVELTWGSHSLDGTGEQPDPSLETTDVITATAGLAYKVDIIEWVPSVGFLAGYTFFAGGPGLGKDNALEPNKSGDITAKVTLGIDYAIDREWALGLQLGYAGFLADAPTSLSDAAYLTGMFRVEHTWGY